jgi:chitin biosynthesis protein CHS5
VLEWDPIQLATADLRSLSLFRNGSKAGMIPRPMELTSTKISGLAVETEYVFQLILRTSAGVYSSDKVVVKTHAMTDLTGITVTPGIMDSSLRASLAATLDKIGAKMIDTTRIDTTHFVCTEPRGHAWERAVEMNIPVVLPDWVKGCENEGRIVGVRGYYLDADPRTRQIGPSVVQTNLAERPKTPPGTPSTKITPPTPEQSRPAVPPKDMPSNGRGEDEDEAEAPHARSEYTTLAETAPEGKTVKEEDSEEDSDMDEDDTKGNGEPSKSSTEHSASPKLNTSKQPKVEDTPEEAANFQDVAL